MPIATPEVYAQMLDTAKQQGFQARSVVGGVYVKLLSSPAIWKKWRERAR